MRIEPTSEKCLDYLWFGEWCLKLQSTGRKAIEDNNLIVICQYTPEKATLIIVQSSAEFFMHPRSGQINPFAYRQGDGTSYLVKAVAGGGYAKAGDGWAELPAQYMYPLVDSDHGTFAYDVNDEFFAWATQDEENYGNMYWINSEGGVSWKGSPNRLLTLPTNLNFPGLTGALGNNEFTPFTENIYSGGAILCTAPLVGSNTDVLVAGACYSKDSEGQTWLLCISHQHVTNEGDYIYVHKSSNKGVDWELVGSVKAGGVLTTGAYITQDGKKFSVGNYGYVIDEKLSSVSLSQKVETTEDGTFEIRPGVGYNYYGNAQGFFPGMTESGLMASSGVTLSGSFVSDSDSNSGGSTQTVSLVRGNPSQNLRIVATGGNGGNDTCGGITLGIQPGIGSFCSVQWQSGVEISSSGEAVLCTENTCQATATATMNPQGIVATYSWSKLPNVVAGAGNATSECGCSSPFGTGVVYSKVTGGGRTAYSWAAWCTPNGEDLYGSVIIDWTRQVPEFRNYCSCGGGADPDWGENTWGFSPNMIPSGSFVGDGQGIWTYDGTNIQGLDGPITRTLCGGGSDSFGSELCSADFVQNNDGSITKTEKQRGPSNPQCTNETTKLDFVPAVCYTLGKPDPCRFLGKLQGTSWYDAFNNPIELPQTSNGCDRWVCAVTNYIC